MDVVIGLMVFTAGVVVGMLVFAYVYPDSPVVPPADAFFLYVEDAGAPQHVGGLVVLRPDPSGGPTLDEVRALVRAELVRLPRFHQRLDSPGRWWRYRWVEAGIDWAWHVTETVLDADAAPADHASGASGTAGKSAASNETDAAADPSGSMAALCAIVSDLAAVPLPRDRPLWRLVLVRSRPGGPAVGIVLLLHHTVADGIGTVVQALHLLRPPVDLTMGAPDEPFWGTRALAVTVGLAQLAAQARPPGRLPAGSPQRTFAAATLDLETVRAVARSRDMRVTDVLLGVIVGAVRRTRPDLAGRTGGTLRVAVPLMVRTSAADAEGNRTAAVMIDIPLTDDGPDPERGLADIRARSARLHTGTRAVASHFVLATALRLLPEPAVSLFARNVYGGRFFHAIVSNMAGPDLPMTFANVPIAQVFPILPTAPGVPLVVGLLSWNGVLGVGLSVDPALLDPAPFTTMLPGILAEFGTRSAVADPGPQVGSGE
ncbi:wax ester/triacylglycerol synthase domain-containing protein [Nocardia alni]|uniref:wax ester/triacylglycerol synthase domain-containing protein n=1 Tax=Nocardia alni TaxID=2815723 RepID=UPI001C214A8A|nr:wax ester/triacylglycerol synthase domain-containing protein [Nocardia alni]